jgi:hypothetical protein
VSGLRKGQMYLDAEEARYKGKPEWDAWVAEGCKKMDILMRASGVTMADIQDTKQFPNWPTMGKYILNKPLDAHKKFLQTFSLGQWKQYSAVAHGGPEGLHEIGMFLFRDGHPHADRPLIDQAYPLVMSMHMMRAAILLLAIVTEVQAAYRFKDEDARINERIVECWQAIQPSFEGKEIYDEHYGQLMKDKGISR